MVTLIHAEPIGAHPGRERIVALLDNGDVAVATRAIGEEKAEAELSFNLGEAHRLSELALGGNSTALTMPGLSRILCASVIALSRAAFQAGLLETRDDDPDTEQTTHGL
ncbi:MAG: hypothetical protein CMF72_22775 [Mameliella sp.]|nr:hypothetical protein [Mameliella sp.]